MFNWLLLLTMFTITFGDGSIWFDVPPKEIFRNLAQRRMDEIEEWKKRLVQPNHTFKNLTEVIPKLIYVYKTLTAYGKIAKPNVWRLFHDIINRFNFEPIPSKMDDFQILDVVWDVYTTITRQLDRIRKRGFIPMRYYQIIWTLLGVRLIDLIPPWIFMPEAVYREYLVPRVAWSR